jgi:hypothetical protein
MKEQLPSACCSGKTLNLITTKGKLFVNGDFREGDIYKYKCDGCGELYTTTESDTETLKNFIK